MAWPGPRTPLDGTRETCEYFVVCDLPADGVVQHPVAGAVPTCRRCAELAGQTLEPAAPGRLPAAG